MKYILITILLTLSVFLFAGGAFTSGETQHYKQTDSYYDNKGRNIQDNSFSSQYIPYTEQGDDYYEENEVFTQDSSFSSQYTQGAATGDTCEACGEPAELLPYNGEDIPMARLFPCPSIQGCLNQEKGIY